MKMPAAYAAGISLRASSGEWLRREPDLRVVVALAERDKDRVMDPRRTEERRQLSLKGHEPRIFHHLLVGLVPQGRGGGDTARGFSLCDQRVDRRVVVAAPVGTWEAERAVEEVGEDGSSVGRPEPVRNPPGLGDVPLARLE